MKKKYFLYIVAVLLFNSAFSPIPQINRFIETLQAITDKANAATELINQRINSKTIPGSQKEKQFLKNDESDLLFFSGKGDDVFLTDINPDEYPFVFFSTEGSRFFNVVASN